MTCHGACIGSRRESTSTTDVEVDASEGKAGYSLDSKGKAGYSLDGLSGIIVMLGIRLFSALA